MYNNFVGVINGSVVSQYNMNANVSILDISIFSHAVVKPRVGLNRHNTHPTLYSALDIPVTKTKIDILQSNTLLKQSAIQIGCALLTN